MIATGEAALHKNFYVCAYARFLVGPWMAMVAALFCSLRSKSRAGKLENR